tara:strand:- start:1624 stop:2430 length:807 start_codon:yes stop_codon:yes gene_type:complete
MGYGDDIMATGEVKYLKKKYSDYKFIIGDGSKSWNSAIFEGNSAIIQANEIKSTDKIKWIKNFPGSRPYRKYEKINHKLKYTWNYSFKAKPGEIFFKDNELEFATQVIEKIKNISSKKIIHIEPNVKIKKGYLNRDWGLVKWQKLVNRLKDNFHFIQTTFGNQNLLSNVTNIKNVNFRTACAIMSKCDLFLGTEGGFHHAAAAMNLKAIIIFGGFIDPEITGYDIHKNIYIKHTNSPCGSKNKCDHCSECMNLITVDLIKEEVDSVLI